MILGSSAAIPAVKEMLRVVLVIVYTANEGFHWIFSVYTYNSPGIYFWPRLRFLPTF